MRPQIICQMMSSVDGRIVGNGWTRLYDGTDYETVIACYFDISNDMGTDAEWLGRETVQTDLVADTFDHGDSPKADHFETFFGTCETARMCIVMDPKGKIRYSSDRIMGKTSLSFWVKVSHNPIWNTCVNWGFHIFLREGTAMISSRHWKHWESSAYGKSCCKVAASSTAVF